jgi:hypothetical protein
MNSHELNQWLARARSAATPHETAMAEDVAAAINKAADDAARRFKEEATDVLAADDAHATWIPPHPDEILDLDALRQSIEEVISPHRDAALAAFVAELPRCIPVEAARNGKVMAEVARQVLTAAQRDELRALANSELE